MRNELNQKIMDEYKNLSESMQNFSSLILETRNEELVKESFKIWQSLNDFCILMTLITLRDENDWLKNNPNRTE